MAMTYIIFCLVRYNRLLSLKCGEHIKRFYVTKKIRNYAVMNKRPPFMGFYCIAKDTKICFNN